MLNSEFINERAVAFARRLTTEEPKSLDKQIALGLRLVTQREPQPAEIKRASAFIADLRAKEGADENEALTMSLAATLGIEVPLHGLLLNGDNTRSYFVRRFDRVG